MPSSLWAVAGGRVVVVVVVVGFGLLTLLPSPAACSSSQIFVGECVPSCLQCRLPLPPLLLLLLLLLLLQ
jgi:hypothetical protein